MAVLHLEVLFRSQPPVAYFVLTQDTVQQPTIPLWNAVIIRIRLSSHRLLLDSVTSQTNRPLGVTPRLHFGGNLDRVHPVVRHVHDVMPRHTRHEVHS